MPARTALVSDFNVSDLCWSGSAAQSPQSPFPSAPRGRRRRVAAVGAGGRHSPAGRPAGTEQPWHQRGTDQTAWCCCCGAGLGVKEARHDLARAAAMQPAATGGGRCPGWSLLPLLELSSAYAWLWQPVDVLGVALGVILHLMLTMKQQGAPVCVAHPS